MLPRNERPVLDDKTLCCLCPEGKDNHFRDCEVMALVAAYELGLRNWKRPAPKPRQAAQALHPLPGFGARSDWFNQRRRPWTKSRDEN